MKLHSIKSKIFIFLISVFLVTSAKGQQKLEHRAFPQQEINKALHEAYINTLHGDDVASKGVQGRGNGTSPFPVLKNMIQINNTAARRAGGGNTFQGTDTLIVGIVPHDTLRITGTYFNNGPIIVANDGVLIFHHADATIMGDLDLFGTGKILGDSSSLSFPQQYFYQRYLIATQKSYVHLETCSLSYGGLSHNLIATDSSTVELINIHNNDWTTAGVYGTPTVILNGSNLAGEYIMSSNAKATFSHVNTLLLWHQFPETAVVNFSFPNGDTLQHYVFNNTVNGVSGIGYSAIVDTSWNVWWGMMPVNGSDITISNSVIRTIGAWFQHGDTVAVSGLVDNSAYSNFTAPLADRNLHLINSSVQTWSLYVFDSSQINITGCILGEVGSQSRSKIISSGFFLDGTGGYFWATDTSLTIASSVAATANVRSEKNGFFIFGYGTLASGIASAINNSLLIVVQSGVPQDPVAYDGAIAWFANIAQPSSAFTNSMVPVIGSAWIDKGPLGNAWMSYGKYSLYYQLQGDTTWTNIVKDSSVEIRNSTFGMWNTNGLTSNSYVLRLVVYNNLGDSVEAMKNVALTPSILGVQTIEKGVMQLNVYPSPANSEIVLNSPSIINNMAAMVSIVNVLGQETSPPAPLQRRGESAVVDVSNLPSGIYFVKVESVNGRLIGKFVKSSN